MVNLSLVRSEEVYAAPALKPMPKYMLWKDPSRHRFHGEHHVRCGAFLTITGTFVVTLILHREVRPFTRPKKSVLR